MNGVMRMREYDRDVANSRLVKDVLAGLPISIGVDEASYSEIFSVAIVSDVYESKVFENSGLKSYLKDSQLELLKEELLEKIKFTLDLFMKKRWSEISFIDKMSCSTTKGSSMRFLDIDKMKKIACVDHGLVLRNLLEDSEALHGLIASIFSFIVDTGYSHALILKYYDSMELDKVSAIFAVICSKLEKYIKLFLSNDKIALMALAIARRRSNPAWDFPLGKNLLAEYYLIREALLN